MMTSRGLRWLKVSLTIPWLIFAVGCSGSTAPEASPSIQPQAVAAKYNYNFESAGLSPVFELVPQYMDPDDGYARDLLARGCLAGVVQYNVIRPDLADPLVDPRTNQLLFDEAIASQHGYPSLRKLELPDTAVPDTITITETMQQEMARCGEQADQRLGLPPSRVLDAIQQAGWTAIDTSEELSLASQRWRDCMAPAGVVDLPASPLQMPPPSIVEETTTTDNQGNRISTSAPVSTRERDVAVADARCRQTSGYDASQLRVRAIAELEAIGADESSFEAARDEYITYGEGVDRVIAELG